MAISQATRFFPPSRKFAVLIAASFLLQSQIAHAGDLQTDVQAALPIVTEAYTYLHRNPELGKKEVKAHDVLAKRLQALGYTQFVASTSVPTAVIAVLDTRRPGPAIDLRAEMDARPLPDGQDEPTSHSPRSDIPGVMHKCGHDAHAALLLGTASILIRNVDKLSGKVVLLFQPGAIIALLAASIPCSLMVAAATALFREVQDNT